MKKTVYLIIISILTIGCIIFGTYYHTKNISFGSIRRLINGEGFSFSFDNDGFSWDDEDGKDGESKVIRGIINQTPDEFSSIDIDANVMAVSIVTGSKFEVESTFNRDYLKPTIEVKNGVLKISQHMPKRSRGNNNSKTVICVPRFTTLDRVKLHLNVGEVNIEGIEGSVCDINNNVGEINLDDVNFDKIDINTNVGEININLTGDVSEYDVDVSTDVGAVNVGGKNYKRRYASKGTGKKSIDAKSNVGEVNIR